MKQIAPLDSEVDLSALMVILFPINTILANIFLN